jgi:hypothetical protein
LVAEACRTPQSSRSAPDPIDDVVREYVRLTVALGDRDHDSLDYAYAPSARSADGPPPSLASIHDRAAAAADRVERAPQADAGRARYLAAHLRALAARARILSGRRLSFDDEARVLFGVALPASVDADAAAYRELERLLPGPGPLVGRYEAFERRQLVPTDRARAVLERALAACRERTIARIALPPTERVEIVPSRDRRWSAYSRYRGDYQSAIEVNVDLGITVDGALALACHEGYPGHHALNVLTDARLVKGRGLAEFTVQPLFSPHSWLGEALSIGAIDLAFPGRDRESFEREVLYPTAGLDPRDAGRAVAIARLVDRLRPLVGDLARRFVDGTLEFARASAALRERALVTGPDELLKFLNEYRSYAASYTFGPQWLDAAAPVGPETDARWRRFETIVDNPWSVPIAR